MESNGCKNEKCIICISNEESTVGQCTKESILYKIHCKSCGNKYYGEISQSVTERKKEHDDGQENENKDNPLWKHDIVKYGGIKQI